MVAQAGNSNNGCECKCPQENAKTVSESATDKKSDFEIVNGRIAQMCNQMMEAGGTEFSEIFGMKEACEQINRVSQEIGNNFKGTFWFQR